MNCNLLYSRLFIASLFILLFNDFFLKAAWPGLISGKLSDFAGVSLLTLFLLTFFPKYKKTIAVSVILVFSWWKSEWSDTFILWLREAGLTHTGRAIDYSDLIALIMVPVALRYSVRYTPAFTIPAGKRWHSILMSGIALFAMTATSQIPGASKSEFIVTGSGKINFTEQQVLAVVERVLQYHGYHCDKKCNSTTKRQYTGKRGGVWYHFNKTRMQISIRQYIFPDQSLIDIGKRDDVKFMLRMRKRLVSGLKELDRGLTLKITREAGFYLNDERPVPGPAKH